MVQDNREQGMPDSKGKGIATHQSNLSPSSTSQDGCSGSAQVGAHKSSIMSRLSASASKLAEDMIIRYPNGAQVADVLPSGKAESSGTVEAGRMQEALSYKSRTDPATSGGMFKSTRSQEQLTSDESNFSSFLDGTTMPEMMEAGNIEKHTREQGYGPVSKQIPQNPAILSTDGIDVVNLLDSGYDEVDEAVTPLPDDEKIALRYHLFDDSGNSRRFPSQRGRWEDTLNFFPDFKADSNSSQELADLLGTPDPGEARHVWISQWQCVLSSYTDEVWGDLSPLVNVAREELDSLSGPFEDLPSKPKALRRLQQILKHVRGM
ncbi:uncharacterized protein F4807DRAFT_406418 [Annulohypoxylon truncatum]|uniref:uncharacterized protein n=1 Tax=Annulohypoxylon truncatum TaxID=327061 RepID=UPI002008D29F|nr:uncharacterized protein F4807DRAFT_406418 [Annulohypoxylon truncatum]KAI1214030.1 hypothetical protein F4807DRAFT_406418 [Annulohypoxylon truncatum]